MSISSTTRKGGPYTGNGVTTQFPFAFKVFQASDVVVVRTDLSAVETTLTLTTDYTVSLNSNQDSNPGGTITTLTAPANGYLITVTSAVQNLQPVTLTNQGGFYPKVINDALDRLTILAQQLVEQVGRAVKVNISSSTTPEQLVNSLLTAASSASASAAAASTSATSASGSATSASDSAAAAALSAANALSSVQAWTTGDVKITLKTVADSGWVLANDGTIGNAASGGTTRANADCSALFALLWNNISNTYAAVSSGRGASAAADFAANKTIALPKVLGRALAIAGAGSGLTSRALGLILGEEAHVLSSSEMPAHAHGVNDPGHTHGATDSGHAHGVSDPGHAHGVSDPGHTHTYTMKSVTGGSNAGGDPLNIGTNTFNTGASATGIAIAGATTGIGINNGAANIGVAAASTGVSTQNAGSGAAHNVMQPTVFMNIMVKL